MILDVLLWCLIGFVSSLGICKLGKGEVLIGDLFMAVTVCLAGPLLFLLFLIMGAGKFLGMERPKANNKKPWLKKKLF